MIATASKSPPFGVKNKSTQLNFHTHPRNHADYTGLGLMPILEPNIVAKGLTLC